jgi:hypothetical protein
VLHGVVNLVVQKDKRKRTEEFVSLFEIDNNNNNIACTTLQGLFEDFQRRVDEIQNFQGPILPEFDEEPLHGVIYAKMLQIRSLELSTNFTDRHLRDLVQTSLLFVAAMSRRGLKPKSTKIDAWICYLVWAKLGKDFAVTAKTLGLKKTRLEDNVTRIRPIINETLRDRWWTNCLRPKPVTTSAFPHVALLIDNHTTQCFRPKTRFAETKIYWDKKNKIYGLKSEVAVSAHEPHYYQFVGSHHAASAHDY